MNKRTNKFKSGHTQNTTVPPLRRILAVSGHIFRYSNQCAARATSPEHNSVNRTETKSHRTILTQSKQKRASKLHIHQSGIEVFSQMGIFCCRTHSCSNRLSRIGAYQNGQRFKWIKCVRAGSIIRIYGYSERIQKVNVRIPECIRASLSVPPHHSTLLYVSSFLPR